MPDIRCQIAEVHESGYAEPISPQTNKTIIGNLLFPLLFDFIFLQTLILCDKDKIFCDGLCND